MKTSKKALKLALALTFGVVVLPSVAAAANDPNSGGFVEEISAGGSIPRRAPSVAAQHTGTLVGGVWQYNTE